MFTVKEKQKVEDDTQSQSVSWGSLNVGFWDKKGELSDFNKTDPSLNRKISLINDALDEIGFTPYHLKLFCLNGMGYAVDSQLTFIQSSVAHYVRLQFHQTYPADSHALYAGLLVGALVWGFAADLIGRKLAFNTSLILSAMFAILSGVMGNYGTYCLFLALSAAASGGNLVLDSTVFLEFLPSKRQWMVTFMASWWALGQTVAVLSAWLFFSIKRFRCEDTGVCLSNDNMGWRYVWIVNGGLVLIVAILRLTVIKLEETPKFLVTNKRDEEAIEVLQVIARKYNRPCSLTLAALEDCGDITDNENYLQNPTFGSTLRLVRHHIRSLFESKILARSTTLIFASWLLLGISYPLYYNFLPQLLAARGAETTAKSFSGVYRDSVISNAVSICGSIIAGSLLFLFPRFGRRGVMALGGLMTMAFFFGYTAVNNRAQNVALSSCVSISINIYYSCLYAYTPESMPSSSRATGNAIAVSLTRLAACFVPLIAYYADTSSPIPVWICGACVGLIGLGALFFPFEPSLQRVA